MTPGELAARLARRALVMDGGMGSMLMARGLSGGQPPERWLSEHPERIGEVHRLYSEAGSDAVSTCTFGGTPVKLRAGGIAEACADVNRRAVDCARAAVRAGVLVAGDIGPTGLTLPPVGAAREEELAEAFGEQARALADAGADFLLIETMFDLREALAAVHAARATGLAVVATMTFESRKRGFFTVMGDPLVDALAALARAGATAVGVNCSVTSDVMARMVAAASSVAAPLVAQPNAGSPRVTADGIAYDASPERFAQDAARMTRSGARVIGGCCGTDPSYIARARAGLEAGGEDRWT